MNSALIKICGITTAQDARLAMAAGADFIGLIFVPGTPRSVLPETAADIVRETANVSAESVARVGVFQNASAEAIGAVCDRVPLDYLQLHGDESPDFCRALSLPVIKTLVVQDGSLPDWQAYAHANVAYFLLEPPKDQPLTLADTGLDCLPEHPTLVAGKLRPENVGAVIARFRPAGVDVAAGVEMAGGPPGRKSPERLRAFCQAVRAGERQVV